MKRWPAIALLCAAGAPGAAAFAVPAATESITLFDDGPVSPSPLPRARAGERWNSDPVFRLLWRSGTGGLDEVFVESMPPSDVARRAPVVVAGVASNEPVDRTPARGAHRIAQREVAGLRRDVTQIKQRLACNDSVFLNCLLFGTTFYLLFYLAFHLCSGLLHACCSVEQRGASAATGAAAPVPPPFPVILSKSPGSAESETK